MLQEIIGVGCTSGLRSPSDELVTSAQLFSEGTVSPQLALFLQFYYGGIEWEARKRIHEYIYLLGFLLPHFSNLLPAKEFIIEWFLRAFLIHNHPSKFIKPIFFTSGVIDEYLNKNNQVNQN